MPHMHTNPFCDVCAKYVVEMCIVRAIQKARISVSCSKNMIDTEIQASCSTMVTMATSLPWLLLENGKYLSYVHSAGHTAFIFESFETQPSGMVCASMHM